MRCMHCGSRNPPKPNPFFLACRAGGGWILWLFIANITATTPGYWETFAVFAWWGALVFAIGDTLFAIIFALGRLIDPDAVSSHRG